MLKRVCLSRGALFPTAWEGNFGVYDCLLLSRLRRPHCVLITVCARLRRLVGEIKEVSENFSSHRVL